MFQVDTSPSPSMSRWQWTQNSSHSLKAEKYKTSGVQGEIDRDIPSGRKVGSAVDVGGVLCWGGDN